MLVVAVVSLHCSTIFVDRSNSSRKLNKFFLLDNVKVFESQRDVFISFEPHPRFGALSFYEICKTLELIWLVPSLISDLAIRHKISSTFSAQIVTS